MLCRCVQLCPTQEELDEARSGMNILSSLWIELFTYEANGAMLPSLIPGPFHLPWPVSSSRQPSNTDLEGR